MPVIKLKRYTGGRGKHPARFFARGPSNACPIPSWRALCLHLGEQAAHPFRVREVKFSP